MEITEAELDRLYELHADEGHDDDGSGECRGCIVLADLAQNLEMPR